MDKIIDNNLTSTSLDNDIQNNELRFSIAAKCPADTKNDIDLSPILLVNLRGGKKKNRDVRAHNLVALVDGGATDSFILYKYAKNTNINRHLSMKFTIQQVAITPLLIK